MADKLADPGPGHPAQVQKRDAAVSEVVRREVRHKLKFVRQFARDELRRDGVSGRLARYSMDEVLGAAQRIEAAIQESLWKRGGPGAFVTLPEGRALYSRQVTAHEAVRVKTSSRKAAKLVPRRAADGRDPLTVCVGKTLRRLPEDVLVKHAPDLLEHYGENIVPLGHGDGCGRIIVDSNEPRAPKQYCDECSERAGNTMNAGLAKTARKRLRAARRPSSANRFG